MSYEVNVHYFPIVWKKVLYCTVLYCTVLYRTLLYRTVMYNTVLYRTVRYWHWFFRSPQIGIFSDMHHDTIRSTRLEKDGTV